MFNTSPFFDIKNPDEFNTLAQKVFLYQANKNEIYKNWINGLKTKISDITHYSEIPFMPIEFFKHFKVISGPDKNDTLCFESSSITSQIPSKHYVGYPAVYIQSFLSGFRYFFGEPHQYCILALLPNYLERKNSSLVYMFNKLIEISGHPLSGFHLHDFELLKKKILLLKKENKKTILIGTTYALLDFSESGIELNEHFMVMETGGMKGKREELSKAEVHEILIKNLKVKQIYGEYGMTELLSQAYSMGGGLYETPPWMKILIRDVNDPLDGGRDKGSGALNIIDLANVNSCSFIATQDLGRITNGKLELLGRFDHSDVRGCNLMSEM